MLVLSSSTCNTDVGFNSDHASADFDSKVRRRKKKEKSNILELLTNENWDDNSREQVRLLDRTEVQPCGHEVQQQLTNDCHCIKLSPWIMCSYCHIMISHLSNLAKGTLYTLLQTVQKKLTYPYMQYVATIQPRKEANKFILHLCQVYKQTICLFLTTCGVICGNPSGINGKCNYMFCDMPFSVDCDAECNSDTVHLTWSRQWPFNDMPRNLNSILVIIANRFGDGLWPKLLNGCNSQSHCHQSSSQTLKTRSFWFIYFLSTTIPTLNPINILQLHGIKMLLQTAWILHRFLGETQGEKKILW